MKNMIHLKLFAFGWLFLTQNASAITMEDVKNTAAQLSCSDVQALQRILYSRSLQAKLNPTTQDPGLAVFVLNHVEEFTKDQLIRIRQLFQGQTLVNMGMPINLARRPNAIRRPKDWKPTSSEASAADQAEKQDKPAATAHADDVQIVEPALLGPRSLDHVRSHSRVPSLGSVAKAEEEAAPAAHADDVHIAAPAPLVPRRHVRFASTAPISRPASNEDHLSSESVSDEDDYETRA